MVYQYSMDFNKEKRLYNQLRNQENETSAFKRSCKKGYYSIAVWLKKNWPNIDHRDNNDYAFRAACKYGHNDIAQWLKNQWPNIDHRAKHDYAIRSACKCGHIDTIKWLIEAFPDINSMCEIPNDDNSDDDNDSGTNITSHLGYFSTYYGNASKNICDIIKSDHFEIVKFIYNQWPILYANLGGINAIELSTKSLCPDTTIWLLDHHNDEFKEGWNNYIFEYFCEKGYGDLAEYIYNSWSNIDCKHENNSAFVSACTNKNMEIAEWIITLYKSVEDLVSVIVYCYERSLDLMVTRIILHHRLRTLSIKKKYQDIFDLQVKSLSDRAFTSKAKFSVEKWTKPEIATCVNKTSAFVHSCEHGLLDIALWLKSTWPLIDHRHGSDKAFRKACENGHIEVAKWLKSSWPMISHDNKNNYACIYASSNGHLHVLQWLMECFPQKDWHRHDIYNKAYCNGHMAIVEYMITKYPDIEKLYVNSFIIVCENGHINMVEWSIANIHPSKDKHIFKSFDGACSFGRIEIANKILKRWPKLATEYDYGYTFAYACKYGYYDVAKWLDCNLKKMSNKNKTIDAAFTGACSNGHYDIVKWIYNKRRFEDNTTLKCALKYACIYGWLDLVRNITAKVDFDDDDDADADDIVAVFETTCKNGQTIMAQYLYKKYASVASRVNFLKVFQKVCCKGRVDTAQWLCEIVPNLNPNKRTFCAVCENDMIDMANWMISRWTAKRLITVGKSGIFCNLCHGCNVTTMQWFIEKILTKYVKDYNAGFSIACDESNYAVIKLLIPLCQTKDLAEIVNTCYKQCASHLVPLIIAHHGIDTMQTIVPRCTKLNLTLEYMKDFSAEKMASLMQK